MLGAHGPSAKTLARREHCRKQKTHSTCNLAGSMVWHAQLRGIIQDELYSAVCAIGLQNTEFVAWQSVALDTHLGSIQDSISSLAAELRVSKLDLTDAPASSATADGSSTPSTARCDGLLIQSSCYTFPVSAAVEPAADGIGLGSSTGLGVFPAAGRSDVLCGNDVDALRLHGPYVDCLLAVDAFSDRGDTCSLSQPALGSFCDWPLGDLLFGLHGR